jgi:hypothetical protein
VEISLREVFRRERDFYMEEEQQVFQAFLKKRSQIKYYKIK